MDANDIDSSVKVAARFNPRARDGRELLTRASLRVCMVSIHAPVMDANISLRSPVPLIGFNPRARDGRESP